MFNKLFHSLALVVLVAASFNTTAVAAGKSSALNTQIGNDISWPQCGKLLPAGQAFGIVGVTGGTAATTNSCLSDELSWANKSLGSNANQPKVQLYVNTANPGQVLEQYAVTTWPSDNSDPIGKSTLTDYDTVMNPYGACTTTPGAYNGYSNNLACSWQYGWNRAVESVEERFKPAAATAGISADPKAYRWWLDVETENSWQTGSADALRRNTASLEGMTAYYQYLQVPTVGLYSTKSQWGQITGTTVGKTFATNVMTTGDNLKLLPSWVAGARSETDAQTKCKSSKGQGFTGGDVVLNQYILRSLDYNYSCI